MQQDQVAVCTLHRGMNAGLLDRIDPRASLAGFVAKEPYAAGCVIEVDGIAPAA